MGFLPVLRAELIGLLLEALLFGCFSILYPISLWMLVYRHRRHGGRCVSLGIWLFSIITVIYLLAMAHLILVSFNVIVMFADNSTTPDGPALFLVSGREDRTIVASIILNATVTFIGDNFMAYRVYVVWGRNWKIVVLPCLLFTGTLATHVLSAHEFRTTGLTIAEGLYTSKVYILMVSSLVCVLTKNLITLLLLLGRLMWHGRIIRQYRVNVSGPSVHWKAARTILQSETMYSATVFVSLVVYATRSRLFLVTSNILPPLVGISFTLIITHVGFDEIMDQLKETNDAEHDLDLCWAVAQPRKNSSWSSTPSFASDSPPIDHETRSAPGVDTTEDSLGVPMGGVATPGRAYGVQL